MMKKIVTAAFATFLLPYSAFAESTNTVKFMGEISTQTCTVDINGSSSNPIVLLPTVPASDLATQGSTAGATTFTVNVTGCASNPATTAIKTVFVGNNITTNGNLGNTGTAGNVSINLLDSDGSTSLDFTPGSATTSNMTLDANKTSTSQALTAQYYAEKALVTAGSVAATAQYAITYQ